MKSTELILPYFRKHKTSIAVGLASLIIVDFLQLLIPRVIKQAVDDLTLFQADARALWIYALEIIGIALFISLFRYAWRKRLIGLSRLIEEGLRNRLFEHLQYLSPSYFDRTKTGDLMAHATNDIMHVRMATGMGIVALTDAVVLGTATIGFMAYIHAELTAMVLIPMPLIALSARFFSKRMHRQYQKVQHTFAELTEVVREQFSGIRVVKAYTMEKSGTKKLRDKSQYYVRQNLLLAKVTKSFFPLMLTFSSMSLGLVLFLGGRRTIFEDITPGDFVAFINYVGLLTWPMMAMGWVVNLIQRGKASLDRIDIILKTRSDIRTPDFPIEGPETESSVTFESVDFAYPAASGEPRRPVLDGVTFHIGKGKMLGVVGPPGSGKTTLLNLIPRLYDVMTGAVRVNGTDVRQIDLRTLRAAIGFVPQEPFLFAGTIRENITMNRNTDRATLLTAVENAALSEDIATFPKGLDTVVGEKGVILSGGQKQRIALARALLKKASIYILDDPVSQVDFKTGNAIIRTIRRLAESHTMILVSHRVAAVRFADRIVVLKNGRIAEIGTHTELVSADRYYAKIHQLQEVEEAFHAV